MDGEADPQAAVEHPRERNSGLELQVLANPDLVAVREIPGGEVRRQEPALAQPEVTQQVQVQEGHAVGPEGRAEARLQRPAATRGEAVLDAEPVRIIVGLDQRERACR